MTEESEFSSDASNTNVHRHRTPKTIPRTKITSTTPVEQRLALSKLKQKLDFDDNKVIFYFLFIDLNKRKAYWLSVKPNGEIDK